MSMGRLTTLTQVCLGTITAGAIVPTVIVTVASLSGAPMALAGQASKSPAKTDVSVPAALKGHGGPVKAVSVHPRTGAVLTGSFDYSMILWQDLNTKAPKPARRFAEHDGAVNAIRTLPDGKEAIAAGDDGKLALWDLTTGKLRHRFTGHTAKVTGLAVSLDGTLAASASWDRTARLWNLKTRKAGPVLRNHNGPVNAVAFSADAKQVFTASYDGTIGIYETATGKFVRPLIKHGWGINALIRLPDNKHLLFGALDGTSSVIDADSGKTVAALKKRERPVLALAAIEKPGLMATAGGDGMVQVFRLGDWKPIETYENPYGPVWALDFAKGGARMYLAGLDDDVVAWQISPRADFEAIDSPIPRRFQLTAKSDDPIERGRIQFARKCSVCHTLLPDGANRAGPTLHGIFGRRIGALKDYPYSPALKNSKVIWTEKTVAQLFELGPEKFVPGTKMPLQKMSDAEQRDALIAFLKAATKPGNESNTSGLVPDPSKGARSNKTNGDKK